MYIARYENVILLFFIWDIIISDIFYNVCSNIYIKLILMRQWDNNLNFIQTLSLPLSFSMYNLKKKQIASFNQRHTKFQIYTVLNVLNI